MTNDMIVLIPGIGGSRLEQDGKLIYDLSLASLPRLIWNWAGGDIAFKGGSGKPDDGVVATDLFNYQLIPGYFGVDDYDGLSTTLMTVVRDPARQFLKFPYDWRASNRWAAEALDGFIRPKLHAWRQAGGGVDAKLWLVCHSMGGLVARYFLEALGGAEITRHLITIGTPHRGAPKALNTIVNGLGWGPLDVSEVIRSFASTYELLPQYPAVRVGNGDGAPLARVAEFFGLGSVLPVPGNTAPAVNGTAGLTPLPHIAPDRLRDALSFHAAIRRPVIQRMIRGDPSPYAISCMFNRRQATPQSACWWNDSLTLSNEPPLPAGPQEERTYQQGDGTVPGPSAVPIEWPDTANAMVVDEKHVAMPSASVVTDLIFNLASPLQVRAYASEARADGTIGLAVPPIAFVGQPFEVVVDAIKAAQLTVSVTPFGVRAAVSSERVLVLERSSVSVVFKLPEAGTYRVTAKSADPTRAAIHDWVVVLSSN